MATQQQREKKKIAAYLDGLGPRCFHFPVLAAGYGKAGIGDRVACIDGFFVMIEVCSEGRGPTAWQEKRMIEAQTAGGIACAVHTLDDFLKVLQLIGIPG